MITIGIYGIPDKTYKGKKTYTTHDHSIALMRNGEVITVVQLERYTGIKHDNRMSSFITTLLERYTPPDEEIQFFSVNSFMGNTFISSNGNLRIEPDCEIKVENIISPAFCRFFPDGVKSHEFAHISSILPFESYIP